MTSSDANPSEAPTPPMLRVVKGDATPEELAALVAVVAAASSAIDHPEPSPPLSQWAQPERMARQPVVAGPPLSWWASSLPR